MFSYFILFPLRSFRRGENSFFFPFSLPSIRCFWEIVFYSTFVRLSVKCLFGFLPTFSFHLTSREDYFEVCCVVSVRFCGNNEFERELDKILTSLKLGYVLPFHIVRRPSHMHTAIWIRFFRFSRRPLARLLCPTRADCSRFTFARVESRPAKMIIVIVLHDIFAPTNLSVSAQKQKCSVSPETAPGPWTVMKVRQMSLILNDDDAKGRHTRHEKPIRKSSWNGDGDNSRKTASASENKTFPIIFFLSCSVVLSYFDLVVVLLEPNVWYGRSSFASHGMRFRWA